MMKDTVIEKKIQELLAKMTLEEKVGQLQQCGPSLVGAFEVSFEELLDMMFDGRISKEEFDRLKGGFSDRIPFLTGNCSELLLKSGFNTFRLKKRRNPWLNSDKELIRTYQLLADKIGCA